MEGFGDGGVGWEGAEGWGGGDAQVASVMGGGSVGWGWGGEGRRRGGERLWGGDNLTGGSSFEALLL